MFKDAFCWSDREPQPCPNAHGWVEQISTICRENSVKRRRKKEGYVECFGFGLR